MSTKAIPNCIESIPAFILSSPKLGPTVLSSTNLIGAAKAPALKSRASSEDSLGLSSPVILNWVPRAALIVAKLIISLVSKVCWIKVSFPSESLL